VLSGTEEVCERRRDLLLKKGFLHLKRKKRPIAMEGGENERRPKGSRVSEKIPSKLED